MISGRGVLAAAWPWLARGSCSLAALMLSLPLCAQTYPTKPVRMVIAFAPGGGTDVVGRVIAQTLSEMWPFPVIADNRPGAGSTIGTDIVAKAVPDGYTIQTVSMASRTKGGCGCMSVPGPEPGGRWCGSARGRR